MGGWFVDASAALLKHRKSQETDEILVALTPLFSDGIQQQLTTQNSHILSSGASLGSSFRICIPTPVWLAVSKDEREHSTHSDWPGSKDRIKMHADIWVRDVLQWPRKTHTTHTQTLESCIYASLSSRHSTWSRRPSLQEEERGWGMQPGRKRGQKGRQVRQGVGGG